MLLELFRSAATTEMRRSLFIVVFDYLVRPEMVVRSAELNHSRGYLCASS